MSIFTQLSCRYLSKPLFAVIGLSLTVILYSFRPIPQIASYEQFSNIAPVYNYIKSNSHDSTFITGNYWYMWPFKAYSLCKGENVPILVGRSEFDPISKKYIKK